MDIHSYISDEQYTHGNHIVTVVSWNTTNDLIATGQDNGEIVISKLIANEFHHGVISISKIYTIVEHKAPITSLSWNPINNKLVSADHGGKLVVWTEMDSIWVPLLINDLSRVPILTVLNSPNSELVSILYANGKVVCGNINGSQKWNSELDFLPKAMCWSSNSKSVYVADNRNNIYILREYGTKVIKIDISSLGIEKHTDQITNLFWNKRDGGTILVTFRSGVVAIFREKDETSPITVITETRITHAAWSRDGSRFVIAGKNQTTNKIFIQFYTSSGNVIRTMELEGNYISSICFSPDDTKLAVCIDTKLTIIQTVPRVPWVYFMNTLVYAAPSLQTNENKTSNVVFFNSKTAEKHIKQIDKLVAIANSKTKCAILSDSNGEASIIITDEFGIPKYSTFISFTPQHIALTEEKCIISSAYKLCIWNFVNNIAKFLSFDYDITSVGARLNTVFVTLTNCALMSIDLVTNEEIGHFTTPRQIEAIDVSSDSTMISLIDVSGFLYILDLNTGTSQEVFRSETWGNKWAIDSPTLFASLEKQNIYIYKGLQPIERIPTMASICEFHSLSILSVDFVKIFKNSLNPDVSCFNRYDTKPINDIHLLLKSYTPKIAQEITDYIASFDCPFAWYLYADFALSIDDPGLAEKCFGFAFSNDGVVITRWMRTVKDKIARRVYALWFLGHQKEALELISQNNRDDLKQKVLNLESELSNPSIDYSERYRYINGKWKDALKYYQKNDNKSMIVQCLANSDDVVGLQDLMEKSEKNSEILKEIGEKFVCLGSAQQAANAFMKYGSPQMAANAYAHFNMWKEALKIANNYKEVERKLIVSRFAAHLADANKNCRAARTLIHCKIYHEAAALLEREGDLRMRRGIEYLMAKKLFVFSAFNAMKSLKARGEKISIYKVWHKAEAVHYLLLAHRLLNEGKYEDALFPAARILFAYQDVVVRETSAALLALAGYHAGYFQECSLGFGFLEHSEKISQRKRERIEQLAVNLFMKKTPDDEKTI
ncbi:cellular response to paclitaxel, partial [Trichomonas vaginalis G3]|uniref:cellular response to paclitaxel n=1 Tax=Trichomonas vaginalis (strain ATCC PRA-98 / G3) TaxID=412133 RepID=UPI0021E579A6